MKGDRLLAHRSNECDDTVPFSPSRLHVQLLRKLLREKETAFCSSLLSSQTQEYKARERGNPLSSRSVHVFEKLMITICSLTHLQHVYDFCPTNWIFISKAGTVSCISCISLAVHQTSQEWTLYNV